MIRRALLLSTALAFGALLAACSDNAGKPAGNAGAGAAQQASPVGVITLKKASFPITTILPGRAETFQTADIRPQVSGLIREIAFKEGGEIKKGDLLYQIEDAPYIAAVEQAKAASPRRKPACRALKAISTAISASSAAAPPRSNSKQQRRRCSRPRPKSSRRRQHFPPPRSTSTIPRSSPPCL